MRPLTLTLSAFGPYAETVTVDFARFGRPEAFTSSPAKPERGRPPCLTALPLPSMARPADPTGKLPCSAAPMLPKTHRPMWNSPSAANRQTMWFVATRSTSARPNGGRVGHRKGGCPVDLPDGRPPVTGTREVTRAIEGIVGLDRTQFSRVAMLAQGEFLQLLLAKTEEQEQNLPGDFAYRTLSAA